LVAASGAHSNYGLLSFWDDNKTRPPTWYPVAMDIVLSQLSSAFMEQPFSIFRRCSDSRQERALDDRIEAAVMLKYNRSRKFDTISNVD
ncbi:unnamed protein product, partial [Sphacelaria rigidula]